MTPIQLAPDSARAELLKVLHLKKDSSVPQSVGSDSSLFAEAFCLEDTGRYCATLWEREEANILYSKVAITFDSNVWIEVSVCLLLLS